MFNRQKTATSSNLRTMTRTALFAAIFTVLAQIYIPLPFSPVPITLQTLGIMLCAVTLRPLEALYAVGLYTLMGLIGLPVFTEFTGGIAKLAGPTGGFIIGWFPAVWLMSYTLHIGNTGRKEGLLRYFKPLAGIILFTVILYGFGVTWFMFVMRVSLYNAVSACMLPFIPGDALKSVVVILSYPVMINMTPRANGP